MQISGLPLTKDSGSVGLGWSPESAFQQTFPAHRPGGSRVDSHCRSQALWNSALSMGRTWSFWGAPDMFILLLSLLCLEILGKLLVSRLCVKAASSQTATPPQDKHCHPLLCPALGSTYPSTAQMMCVHIRLRSHTWALYARPHPLHCVPSPSREGRESVFDESINEQMGWSKLAHDAVQSQDWSPKPRSLALWPSSSSINSETRVVWIQLHTFLASSPTLGNLYKLSDPCYIISKMRQMTLIAITS